MEEHLEISKPFEFDMVLVSWDKHVTKFHAFGAAIFVTMQSDAGHKIVWNSLEHNSKRNKKQYDGNVAIAASILLSGGTFQPQNILPYPKIFVIPSHKQLLPKEKERDTRTCKEREWHQFSWRW